MTTRYSDPTGPQPFDQAVQMFRRTGLLPRMFIRYHYGHRSYYVADMGDDCEDGMYRAAFCIEANGTVVGTLY